MRTRLSVGQFTALTADAEQFYHEAIERAKRKDVSTKRWPGMH